MIIRIAVFILLLFANRFTSAQTIEPFIFNSGGGSFSEEITIDWSIGEATSIDFFEDPIFLSTGVLQPITEKTGKPSFYIIPWAKEEITIFPIPTYRLFDVDIKIPQTGTVTTTIFDQRSRVIQNKKTERTIADEIISFDLAGLTPGLYYLSVTLGGVSGSPIIRQGTFKIQKL